MVENFRNDNHSVAQRLATENWTIPDLAPDPIGNFRNAQRLGNVLYISGQGPMDNLGNLQRGKLGKDLDIGTGYQHAALVGLNILAVIKREIDDFSRVRQFVKILGMVNAVPDFQEHPQVINGCSDVFRLAFGVVGEHARSAVGVGSLPNNISVEIEAIVEVD